MGSMSKVMQKIQEGDPDEVQPVAEAEAVQTESDPAEGQVADMIAAVEAADGGEPSAFVAGEAEDQSASISDAAEGQEEDRKKAVDTRTVEWEVAGVDPVVVTFHDRYSAICEQYRSVRARLLTMNSTGTPQVIAITSAIPEEGKSVSTINLAMVMAEGGEHRILMADADFRRTSMARMLGIPQTPGLANVLAGQAGLAETLRPSPLPNLKVIPAGTIEDNAYSDLLGGPALEATLEEFRKGFDYVFLDTPPVTTVSDACLLAPRCDGAIMVIQMRRTPEPTVQQAVRTLQANNVKIIGSMLSRFRERGSGYYEHYYSSYYYR